MVLDAFASTLCYDIMVAMDALKTKYHGRAYGMDIRVEREDDGTLSVYEAPAFTDLYTFVRRGPAEEIIAHYDVSGTMRKFFGD